MRHTSCLIGFLATLAICNADVSDILKYGRLKHEPPWRVSVVVELPYMFKKTPNPTKNEDFDGYIPDVLMKIGEQLHQTYIITQVPDGDYGDRDPGTGKWSGMIGMLIDGTVDLAATPLTVREDRMEVLDFTEPLFSVRCILIMIKSPQSSMSLKDIVEKTDTTILIQTDKRIVQLIRNSTLPHFMTITAALDKDPTNILDGSIENGIKRVREGKGKYGLITYSCNGLYFATRECQLAAVDTYLPQTDLALAVAKGSPIKEQFNGAVTHLRELGELVKIRQKWWKDECESGAVDTWGSFGGLRHLSMVLAVAAFLRLL